MNSGGSEYENEKYFLTNPLIETLNYPANFMEYS